MTRSLAAFLLLLVLATAAHGFGLGLGNRFGKLGAIGGGAGAAPPASCSGVIDLSAGCPLPMLGS